MTSPLFLRTAFAASIIALAGTGAILAQDTPAAPQPPGTSDTTPPGGGGGGGAGGHHGGWMMKVLTPAERAELKKDHDQVLVSDPDLKKESDDLEAARPAPDASDDDKQAYMQKRMALMGKVRDAVEKIDPAAAAIYAKMDAARKAHMAQGGGGAPGGGQ